MNELDSVGFLALLTLLGAVAGFILTRFLLAYSMKLGLLDHPGPRRSHDDVTPRGGGVSVLLTTFVVGCGLILLSVEPQYPLPWFLGGLVVTTLLGFWEDHRTLPRRLRLFVQIAACVLLVWGLKLSGADFRVLVFPESDLIGAVSGSSLGNLLSMTVLVLGMVWMINLFNFMDGINGLASSQTIFAASIFALGLLSGGQVSVGLLALVLAAASLGFLPWNFPKARIFLGDAGSYGIGFSLAALMVYGGVTQSLPIWSSMAVMGVFVVDATLTLAVRVVTGAQWYNPHREHAYQLLVRRGWRHSSVVLSVTFINVAFITPVVLWSGPEGQRMAAAGVLLTLSAVWCIVRWWFYRSK